MSRIEEALRKASRLRSGSGDSKISDKPDVDINTREKISRNIDATGIDNPYIVTLNEPGSPVAEEYRKLKSTIMRLTRQEGFKNTVMVTSSLSGEGKSIIALNLSITMSQEYDYTVLLIDADFRRPSLAGYLNITPEAGLSDCLVEGLDVGSVIVKTGIEKLSFLPSGKEVDNPVELFSSQKMQDLINEIKHHYPDRYIVIDTPPVLLFAETGLISSMADGTVFVVKEGLASLQNITEAIDSLKDSNVLGIVYNDVSLERLNGRHQYYQYYQYYNNYSKMKNPID